MCVCGRLAPSIASQGRSETVFGMKMGGSWLLCLPLEHLPLSFCTAGWWTILISLNWVMQKYSQRWGGGGGARVYP